MIQMVSADVDGYSNAAQECLPDSTCLTFFQAEMRRIKEKKTVKMKYLFHKKSSLHLTFCIYCYPSG